MRLFFIFTSLIFINSASLILPDKMRKSLDYLTNTSVYEFTSNLVNESSLKECSHHFNNKTNPNIYQNSFSIRNFLGKFTGCSKINYSFYLLVLIKKDEYNPDFNKNIDEIFLKILKLDHFSFGICLPSCLKFKQELNISFANKLNLSDPIIYRAIPTNLTEQNNIYLHSRSWTLYLLIIIFVLSILLALFFTFFTNVSESEFGLKLIKPDDNIEELLGNNSQSNDTNNDGNEVINLKNGLEAPKLPAQSLINSIASSFNIKSNINRFFKSNDNKDKIMSRYKNDNKLSFINGVKGLILILINIATMMWAMILCPNTNMNKIQLDRMFNSGPVFFFVYYMNFSFSMFYAFSGFIIVYKFNCHFRQNENQLTKVKSFMKFLLPQFHYYLIYLFMLILIINLGPLVYFVDLQTGPFTYMYSEVSNRVLTNSIYFISTVFSFLNEFSLSSYNFFLFFYIEANHIHFFILIMIWLIFYIKWENSSFFILILFYIATIIVKTVEYTDKSLDFIFINNKFWSFKEGISCYLLGAIFGIFYYEYNINELAEKVLDITEDSSLGSGSLKIKKSNQTIYHRNFIKKIGESKCLKNISLLVGIILIIIIIVNDVFILHISRDSNNAFYLVTNLYHKIYLSLEVELFLIAIFTFIFRFVIFSSTFLKTFLEAKFWISLSRSFYIIAYLQLPLAVIYLLAINIALTFSLVTVIFISLSIFVFLYIFGFILMIFIEIPWKVFLKTCAKHLLK